MSEIKPSAERPLSKLVRFLSAPPFAVEVGLWLILAAVAIGLRIYLWRLLPAYLWSRDAGSYAEAAFHWLDRGEMIFDGRRGPIYTLLIAAALKLFGTMSGVVWLQQGLGALAVLGIVAAARLAWGRVSVIPLFACGLALAAYGLPLHLGHMIRNEATLFVLAAAALCFWWVALQSNSRGWLFAAAVAGGLVTMTKNIFLPFPLALLGGVLLFEGHLRAEKLRRIALILAGFALPFAALKLHDALASHVNPPEPQSGILFYGRTAQWTRLDGGIEPALKTLIRADVESYRARTKMDNNIVIKRTIVPRLWAELQSQGKTPSDLDRLCRRLAVEAVQTHPAEFWKQIRGDLYKLHYRNGVADEFPNPDEIEDGIRDLRGRDASQPTHRTIELEKTLNALTSHQYSPEFAHFHRIISAAWLFQGYPVLWTSIALLPLVLLKRGREREFFLGCAAIWFFNVVLLSTVERPIERYLMPLIPIIFWTLAGVIVLGWRWAIAFGSRSGQGAGESAPPESRG